VVPLKRRGWGSARAPFYQAPIILQGWWSETVERSGNFVFRFAGNLSPQIINLYQESLCSHLPAAESTCVVPTAGWTWVQLRGVDVARMEGNSGIIYNGAKLLMALRTNPCFNDIMICVKPHWQGNLANFRGPVATVITAILDEDNTVCQRVSKEGVCMFGRQVKFVRAGSSPPLVQCSQCHEVGHCHRSAGTPLRTHANGEDLGLEESRAAIRT
jgi:hypothetical protein